MSYELLKRGVARERFYLVEYDMPRCTRTYGVAPCNPVPLLTGDGKCFNTGGTCQDPTNYNQSNLTVRFCTKRAPIPGGISNAIPSIIGEPRIALAKLNLKGGIGVRGGVTIQFTDHPSDDSLLDPYVSERTYDPLEHGTYWGKYRARDIFYVGRNVRVFEGYLDDGKYEPANFKTYTYVVEQIQLGDGSCTLTCKDLLKLTDDDRAQIPEPSSGVLNANITDTATNLTLSPAGVGNAEYNGTGRIRIDSEVMDFVRSGDLMTISNRGGYGTTADSHSQDATVQQCRFWDGETLADILYDICTEGADIDTAYLPLSEWQTEANLYAPSLLSATITEPMGSHKLLKELGEQVPHYLWWDPIMLKIRLSILKDLTGTSGNILDEDSNILADSLSVQDKPDMRVSQVRVYYGMRDVTSTLEEPANFSQLYVRADLNSETDDEYGSARINTIYSRWFLSTNRGAAVNLATKIGQRFGETPRQVSLKTAAKDNSYDLTDIVEVEHRKLQDANGMKTRVPFQIITKDDRGDVTYTGLEFRWSRALPGDEGANTNLIYINETTGSINLRTLYDQVYPSFPTGPDAAIVFEFAANALVVGDDTATVAVDTGSFAGYPNPIQIKVAGNITGRGGAGGSAGNNGGNGGTAMNLQHPVNFLLIDGIVGAGGGGGGGAFVGTGGPAASAGGGGAAAFGLGGGGVVPGNDALLQTGGAGVVHTFVYFSVTYTATSGAGGDLAQAGVNGSTSPAGTNGTGGTPGNAIVTNGNAITYGPDATPGNIIGVIV